jgi:drug/metabolite transporter (DMT)-like permease
MIVAARAVAQIVWVAPTLARHGRRPFRTAKPWLHVLRGLLSVASWGAYYYAFQELPMATATVLSFTSIMWTTALAPLVLGEKVGWRRWTAIGIGFVGVLIILQPGVRVFSPAALVPLLSAFMFALYGLLTRYVSRRDTASVSFFWTGAAGAVAMTPLGLWAWEPMTRADWGWMGLLCCTAAFAHWLLIRAYEVAEASAVQPFAYLQLVFASGIGILIFGEALHLNVAIGAAVVVCAGLFTLWRQRVSARA